MAVSGLLLNPEQHRISPEQLLLRLQIDSIRLGGASTKRNLPGKEVSPPEWSTEAAGNM